MNGPVLFDHDRVQPRTATEVLAWLTGRGGVTVSHPPDGLRPVTGISSSSRDVQPGHLFVALPGATAHGNSYASEALRRGATAVLTDRGIPGVATFVVSNPRELMGPLCVWFYRLQSTLELHAVTGTNGKTTTTYALGAALRSVYGSAGEINTIHRRIGDDAYSSRLTTPEAPHLCQDLSAMAARGIKAAAIEVSSHALVQHRIDGLHFRTGIFTNLSRDHLDFHGSMERYFAAKRALFERNRCDIAVVNIADPYGLRLTSLLNLPFVTFSTNPAVPADFVATIRRIEHGRTVVLVTGSGREIELVTSLLGRHNIENLVGALASMTAAGHDPVRVAAAIGSLKQVPGRLEPIELGQDFDAWVDFAHNPAGLRACLDTVRVRSRGRIILVLGAPGGRDPDQRPEMGEIAGALADLVLVTDDDAFDEDPGRIRDGLLYGLRTTSTKVVVEPSRRAAIRKAVLMAEPSDSVVVAGRGHLSRQISEGREQPFNDRTEIMAAIKSAGRGADGDREPVLGLPE